MVVVERKELVSSLSSRTARNRILVIVVVDVTSERAGLLGLSTTHHHEATMHPRNPYANLDFEELAAKYQKLQK